MNKEYPYSTTTGGASTRISPLPDGAVWPYVPMELTGPPAPPAYQDPAGRAFRIARALLVYEAIGPLTIDGFLTIVDAIAKEL